LLVSSSQSSHGAKDSAHRAAYAAPGEKGQLVEPWLPLLDIANFGRRTKQVFSGAGKAVQTDTGRHRTVSGMQRRTRMAKFYGT